MPDEQDMVAAALQERRLSSRDKAQRRMLDYRMEGIGQGTQDAELTQENLRQLGLALQNAKTPAQRAILMQELAKMKELAQTLAGPVQPPDLPPGAIDNSLQLAPYDPRTQQPDRPTMTVPVQHHFGGNMAAQPYRSDIPPFYRERGYAPQQEGAIPGVEGRKIILPNGVPMMIPPAMSGVRG